MIKRGVLFLLLVALCCISNFLCLKDINKAQRVRLNSLNEVAKETFTKALREKIENNYKGDAPFSIFQRKDNGDLFEVESDSIQVITKDGIFSFPIPKNKLKHSLYRESKLRTLLGCVWEENIIPIDTLQKSWNNLLLKKGIRTDVAMRYTYENLKGDIDTIYCASYETNMDSLTTAYLGAHCEIEFTGYVNHKKIPLISSWHFIILGFPWLFVLLGIYAYRRILPKLNLYLCRRKKILLWCNDEKKKAKVFHMIDSVIFESTPQTLRRGTYISKLTPQSTALLLLFLRAEKHEVSRECIDQNLWGGKASKMALQTAISRLREHLNKITPLDIIHENGIYSLKIVRPIKGIWTKDLLNLLRFCLKYPFCK